MAIDIRFDLVGNPEPPTIILANRNGNKLGQLKVETDSIEVSDKFNDASEFSFIIHKYIDDELTPLWDKVVNFKLVYCDEWDCWFEIKVDLDEDTKTTKTVYCTQLGQAELSQIMLYNVEINTEKDIERDDYKISILYDENDVEASTLHRLLKDKAPHYSIAYVSPTIAKLQRSFSFNGTSILDAFQQISEEIKCLFKYYAAIKDGVLHRYIYVYDLQQYCNDCGNRSEYIDRCHKCGSTNITNGYGEDTLIFVTSDELASNGIQLVTDTDSVKNCFKLEAGDDLMTATIANCNPNGTEYIWYFSEATKEDMTDELVSKIESYDKLYENQYNKSVSNVDAKLLASYNSLVDKYSVYNRGLQKITSPITGYSNLMNAYYNTIDLSLYLKSVLMPSIEISETNAAEQAKLLTASSLSPTAVTDVNTVSLATANSAVLAMAKVIVKSTFKVEIKSSELTTSGNKKYWNGSFIVTNYSDEEDVAESNRVSIELNDDLETVTKQKIEKLLTKENSDDLSITGLFKKEYDDFCAELKKYALNPLTSFRDACQACIDILIDQGVADANTWSDNENGSDGNLYEKLYLPYYNKLQAIEREMKIREDEINIILGVYDNDGNLIADGLQTNIEECRNQIQDSLNFEKYLGETLWLEFCSYRREDTYSNDNYISDGLNNAELFKKAQEFFDVAKNEIYKSAELQHSISTTLNNLLAIEKFKPLVSSFKNGNWIRVQIDDQIYKLRLLEYGIKFGDFDNISVEFSDVTKIKNGITDVESILSQASSMATSYDSVKRQSTQGSQASGTVNQWLSSGLNSAMVRIQSNDTEDITLTKNGLLCRSYDDITDSYSPEQLKLTHNIMAYTDDNWKSVRQAIGKHNYIIFDKDENKFVEKIGYGMSADFVTAGIVSGSQIIGGDVYSDNYSAVDRTGSYLNLRDGTFSFGGGSLRFEGGQLLISSPDVLTTNQVTEINEKYLKTTSVYAENLQINSANITGSLTIGQMPDGIAQTGDIPTNVSQLINDSGYQTETGVTTIVGGVVTTDYVNALGITAGSVAAENITGTTISGKSIMGGYLLIGDKQNTYAEINEDGILSCRGADITGNISVESGVRFLVNSGGTVQISAGDGEGSYINLGEAFSATKNGVSATNGYFNSLSVGGKNVLTEDSLDYKVIVSATEPNERGIIWVQPSLVTKIMYKGYTADARDDRLFISNAIKTFDIKCETMDVLPNGQYRYTVNFPICLPTGDSYESDIVIFASAYKIGDQDIKITFPEYTIPYLGPWDGKNIELSVESNVNLCADAGDIRVSIGARNSRGWLYVDKESYVTLSAANRDVEDGTVQACAVYYKP